MKAQAIGIYDRPWGPTLILRGNNPKGRMSALGQKQTLGNVRAMSALHPKADIPLTIKSGSVLFFSPTSEHHGARWAGRHFGC
jgi:hypothetical protein